MRNAFAREATEIARNNKKLVLLAGDIGNRLFDNFKEENPDRFYNCGISEAMMTGLAAGFATAGFTPVTYTITPFNTLRCLEQIKLDVCYPNLPVTIVGTGAGLSYASLGATHHSLDDIAVLRALPNIQILVPGDAFEVSACLHAAIDSKKPTYIRLGKKGEPTVHRQHFSYEIGTVIPIKNGSDHLIISVGNMLGECVQAAESAQKLLGLSPEVVSLGTVYPLDKKYLREAFENFQRIVVVEEHGFVGGAGSAILEWAHRAQLDTKKLLTMNAPKKFITGVGSQKNARSDFGLDSDTIVKNLVG